MISSDHRFGNEQAIHACGVRYLRNLLENAGFTIRRVNDDPTHHFHIHTEFKKKSLLIAVRTGCHPDTGTLDSSTLKLLLSESEELGATPYFAGLSLLAVDAADDEADGSIDGRNYKVFFDGMRAVRESDFPGENG